MTTHLEALRALVRKWRGHKSVPMDELEAALGAGPDGKMGEAGASGTTETGKVEAVESAKHEREMSQVVDERDRAEEALSQAYYLVIGDSPEWSNVWGTDDCLEEIEDALTLLRKSAKHVLCAGCNRALGEDEAHYTHAPPSTQREEDHSIPLREWWIALPGNCKDGFAYLSPERANMGGSKVTYETVHVRETTNTKGVPAGGEAEPTYYLVIYEANGPGAYASSVFDWPPSKESLANFKRYGHKVVPLYTHPPLAKARTAEVGGSGETNGVVMSREIVEFLLGEGTLMGFWFHERPQDNGAFWWRKHLRALAASPPPVEPHTSSQPNVTVTDAMVAAALISDETAADRWKGRGIPAPEILMREALEAALSTKAPTTENK